MIAAIHLTLTQVAAALALVALAAAVSIWQHADLERDVAVATIRSFIQLTAIGYVIKLIFDENNLVFVFALIAAMVVFGALTARSRARKVPHAFWPLLVALALGIALTFLLDYLDDRIRSKDDVTQLLGIPIYAVIPRAPSPVATDRQLHVNK